MSTTAAIVFSFLAGSTGAETANNAPSADLVKARELVKQLADNKYKVRETAERKLIGLGLGSPASIEALKEGEKSTDLHVQERCRQLQPIIRGLNLQKRIDAFTAKREGALPKDLPFVAKFIKATGDTKEARELFAEVLHNHAMLLDTAERDQAKGKEMFGAYCQEVNNRLMYRQGVDYQAQQKSITRADVALYFLLSSELKAVPDKTGQITNYGWTFLNAPVLPDNLAKETAATLPFKKMFLSWLEAEPQPWLVQRGLQVAADAQMKETLPLVLKYVKDKNVQIYTRAQTALLLAKIGSKEHLKEIAPLLDDKTVVGSIGINNVQGQVQMRDVALAVSIKLSGQKMADYDFDVMKSNEQYFHTSYIYCAFSGDGKREAAHKKYKESLEKQKK
jgi:hypothetical protein